MKAAKMKLNTLVDIEETKLRLKLKHEADNLFKLQMLANFRPGASLRAINNQRQINCR